MTKTYTIYWKYALHGEQGTFTIEGPTPIFAAEWAAQELAWDYITRHCVAKNEDDEDQHRQFFLNNLEVDVYEGVSLVRPISQPLASYT